MSVFKQLAKTGIRKLPTWFMSAARALRDPSTALVYLRDYNQFKLEFEPVRLAVGDAQRPTFSSQVLIHSGHFHVPAIKEELMYGATLIANGVQPVYLISRHLVYEKYAKLLPGARVVFWDHFAEVPSLRDTRIAREIVGRARNAQELIDSEVDGIALGRHVLSAFMRTNYLGTIELPRHRADLIPYFAYSLAAIRSSVALLESADWTAILMNERGYTPYGEFFDAALIKDIRVVQYVASHRDDARVFKRYRVSTRTEHPYSLSDMTWQDVNRTPLTTFRRDQLISQWRKRYEGGEWFNYQRIQRGKQLFTRDALVGELGIDPSRKTAIVFAHIFWDATFFYGEGLYEDYQSWFVETVRIANRNTSVNWLVKLHPVNVWRRQADGAAESEYSEIAALRHAGMDLAPHVKLIMPETKINTWGLFEVSDYCITVRGTVGFEMAALGKTVIAAGSGPYSQFAFTVNPKTKVEYEAMLMQLPAIDPLSAEARERALKYADTLLNKKPCKFAGFQMDYDANQNFNRQLYGRPKISVNSLGKHLTDRHSKFWVDWLCHGENDDCIWPGTDEA